MSDSAPDDEPLTVLLAFATDKTDNTKHLRKLAREENDIRDVLEPLVSKGLLAAVESRTNVTPRKVLDLFQSDQFHGRTAIFHFGGHASGSEIVLADRDEKQAPLYAEGLAEFLGRQPRLKLVFLNGCSTAPQVALLRQAGVDAVVATSRAIKDDVAAEFARRFYAALVWSPIAEAFRLAQSGVKAVHGGKPRELVARDHPPLEDDQQWPWILDPPDAEWSLFNDQPSTSKPKARPGAAVRRLVVVAMMALGMLGLGGWWVMYELWPWSERPEIPSTPGILVTTWRWASDDAQDAYSTLCKALKRRDSQGVDCKRISNRNTEPHALLEWAEGSNAGIILYVQPDRSLRFHLVGELARYKVLSHLPVTYLPHDGPFEEMAALLDALRRPLGVVGVDDVPQVEIEQLGYCWATLATLLRMVAPDAAPIEYERLEALSRCKENQTPSKEEEFYCAIAMVMNAAHSPSCDGSQQTLQALRGDVAPQSVRDVAVRRLAECLVADEPEVAAQLVLEALDRGDPTGCKRLGFMSLMPRLVEQRAVLAQNRLELLQRMRRRVDGAQCPPVLVSRALSSRGVAYTIQHRWADAAADFYAAWKRQPEVGAYLRDWAESMLHRVEETDGSEVRARLVAELAPRVAVPVTSVQQARATLALAYFLWVATKQPKDAQRIVELYERVPEQAELLRKATGESLVDSGLLSNAEARVLELLWQSRGTGGVPTSLLGSLGLSPQSDVSISPP